MNELKSIVKNLISHKHEEEWFEFKENWFESHALGEYISSMSNAAAMVGEEYAYFVWGVENNTHIIREQPLISIRMLKMSRSNTIWRGWSSRI